MFFILDVGNSKNLVFVLSVACHRFARKAFAKRSQWQERRIERIMCVSTDALLLCLAWLPRHPQLQWPMPSCLDFLYPRSMTSSAPPPHSLSAQTNADPCVSRRALESDQMSGVLALARLYQMEPRWLIRQPLTQALGLACGLHRDCIGLLLSSVLPSELAR